MAQRTTTEAQPSITSILLIAAITVVAFMGILAPSATPSEAVTIGIIAVIANLSVISEWFNK